MSEYGVTNETQSSTNLFAGGFPVVEVPITVVSGSGVLVRGTVLGKVTASGKYKPYADGNSDGSQTAKLILADDIDATAADITTTAYRTGEFNENGLTGLDAAAKVDFESTPIVIKQVL